MKVYVTVIPEQEDLIALDSTKEKEIAENKTELGEKLGMVLTFAGIMMKENVPTRLVITNMKRDRTAEFRKASEL